MTEEIVKPKHKKGGAMPGAGRPKGSVNTKGKGAIQDFMQYTTEKLIPVIGANYAHLEPKEIMLLAARLAAYEGRWSDAAGLAEKAAPYYNRRLASVQIDHKVTHDITQLSDDELIGYIQVTEAEFNALPSPEMKDVIDDRARMDDNNKQPVGLQRK